MINNEIKNIIKNAIVENRDTYTRLTLNEKLAVISSMVWDSEQALIDADYELTLQKAVSNTIKHNGNDASLKALYEVIKKVFVDGYKISNDMYEPHYQEKIESLLNDEWMKKNARPNEHTEFDNRQRAGDVASSLHGPSHY